MMIWSYRAKLVRQCLALLVLVALLLPGTLHAKQINILVIAHHGEQVAFKEWQPTIDHLQQSLPQHSFSLVPVPPDDLARIEKLVAEEEVDFMFTQPAIYVDLELNYGVSRTLTMVKQGGLSELGSVIIVRRDSDIKSISDLHDKTIAGAAKLGFGGWLIGYKEMLDQGFDPYKEAKEVVFLGTQPRQIQAVLDGEVDAAVIRTGLLENSIRKGIISPDDLRVLSEKDYPYFPYKASTALYPEWAFAKVRGVSNELSKSVALSLLEIEPNSEASRSAKYEAWSFPYDYQPVHDLLKTLKAGPYQNYGEITLKDVIQQHKNESILVIILLLTILALTLIVYRANHKLTKEQSEKENLLVEMQYMASHDIQTQLPNRWLFIEYLEKMIHDAARRQANMAVLFIDLDNFKPINDQFGHKLGDEVLFQVAREISNSLRVNDICGRFGGDEFMVALNDIDDMEEIMQIVRRVTKKITDIELPEAADFMVGASVGIIHGTPYQCNAEQLIRISDELMYKAKHAGKGTVVLRHMSTGEECHVECKDPEKQVTLKV